MLCGSFALISEAHTFNQGNNERQEPLDGRRQQQQSKIRSIIIQGNKHVPTSAILNRVPFRPNEFFDAFKTGSMIRNLYKELRRFTNITVKGRIIDDEFMDLFLIVEEKIPFKEAQFVGNTQVSTQDIMKKINFSEIPAIDAQELVKYVAIIQKLYLEKGYHRVDIKPELIANDDGTATAKFHMHEYKKSMIKRILFKGNNCISSKKLASTIMTREEWILSLVDKSGTYHPERLEADRHFIESLYQNNGFLNAKVTDIDVETDPASSQLTITYYIEEGGQYCIKEVKAPGNEQLTEEQLLSVLPVRPGMIYSRELVSNCIENLEMLWGNRGYAYAHIEPSIIPDDETKTVNLSFHSDLGSKVFLNKIIIKGHKKTRDKVIRRNITLCEGQPITNFQMEDSKNRIEGLGYFDQKEGVNWKMTRLSEDSADLELIVKEAPTGNANIKLGIGGTERDIKTPIAGLSAEAAVSDRNLFGSGIQLNASARLSKDERSVIFSLANPWLFDKPLFGKIDAYYKSVGYDEFRHTRPVNERDCGANATLGFVTGVRTIPFIDEVLVRLNLGIDSIRYDNVAKSTISGSQQERLSANEAYQTILDKLFCPAEFTWISVNVGQDTKNHPMHPSRGHTWSLQVQFAAPTFSSCIGFTKIDLDFNWFTPVIGERDLVFHIHGHTGFAKGYTNHLIPYRELFNIGGPASVRGFLFGQIGPQFYVNGSGDPIGGSKAFFWNAELIFPITPDFNMKGVFFYDGGTGWDNPYVTSANAPYIRNNRFDYRQSVGAGIRVYNPVPVRIDWGFKLDPRKGEPAYEVHFGMAYDW